MDPAQAAAESFRLLCDPDTAAARETALDQDSWTAIVAAAQRHGLAPLLFRHLTELYPASLPLLPARATLRAAFLGSLSSNLRLREQLTAIVTALAAYGITPILLKGAHLAFSVYPDPGLRPMGDIDLLVEPAAVRATAALLIDLGYSPTRPYDLHAELTLMHHLPPFGKPGCHFVEIHWALLRPEEPYRIDTAGLWARSRPAGIPGIPARMLDPADLLLHLCLHAVAADRLAGGLRKLADIVETLRVFGADPALREAPLRAASWGASRCLALSLALCDNLAPGALPPDLLRTLTPESVSDERLALARSLVLNPPEYPEQISANFARAIGAPPAQALRGLLRGFFPSRTFLATFYGINPQSAAIWPCYPRRWAYLLGCYAVPALRAIVGGRDASEQTARKKDENTLADWLAGID